MMKMDYVFGLTIFVHACKKGKQTSRFIKTQLVTNNDGNVSDTI